MTTPPTPPEFLDAEQLAILRAAARGAVTIQARRAFVAGRPDTQRVGELSLAGWLEPDSDGKRYVPTDTAVDYLRSHTE